MIAVRLKVHIYDPNCQTFLSTDASNVGLGAVLTQRQNGKEITICCVAHTLMHRECNYSTGECEALAAVWGCEYFKKFLLGWKFTLCTDHSALQQLLTNPGRDLRKSSKFIRWAERLSIFDYKPEYCCGSEITVTDALSRLPAPTIGPAIDDPGNQVILKCLSAEGLLLSEFISATAADLLCSSRSSISSNQTGQIKTKSHQSCALISQFMANCPSRVLA